MINKFKPKGVKAKSPSLYEESRTQCSCILWFDLTYQARFNKKLLFAVPNGGRRDKAEGAKMKREGVRAGVPDLMLAVASKGFHGMFIEMKTKKGDTSENQDEMIIAFTNQGYKVVICRSLEEFIKEVTQYLN